MKKKPKMYFDPEKEALFLEGTYYLMGTPKYKKIGGIKHIDYVPLSKYDTEKQKKNIKFVTKGIKELVSKEELLEELLGKELGPVDIKRLIKAIKEGKKIEKQKGCIGLKVGSGKKKDGGMYVSLVE